MKSFLAFTLLHLSLRSFSSSAASAATKTLASSSSSLVRAFASAGAGSPDNLGDGYDQSTRGGHLTGMINPTAVDLPPTMDDIKSRIPGGQLHHPSSGKAGEVVDLDKLSTGSWAAGAIDKQIPNHLGIVSEDTKVLGKKQKTGKERSKFAVVSSSSSASASASASAKGK